MNPALWIAMALVSAGAVALVAVKDKPKAHTAAAVSAFACFAVAMFFFAVGVLWAGFDAISD